MIFSLNTWVWRKHTNTGLLLNFYAICPTTRKSGLIKCSLHCAKYICSTLKLYKQEDEKLRVIFRRSAHPNWLVVKVIDKFEIRNNTNNNNNNHSQSSESDFLFTFGISYVNKPSHIIEKRLRNS